MIFLIPFNPKIENQIFLIKVCIQYYLLGRYSLTYRNMTFQISLENFLNARFLNAIFRIIEKIFDFFII